MSPVLSQLSGERRARFDRARIKAEPACSRPHHHLGRIDRFVLAFVGGDVERLGDRLQARQNVRDGRLQVDPAGSYEADGVLEVLRRADVGKDVTQAPLAERVDIDLQADGRTRKRR